jgi:hypothetical protein
MDGITFIATVCTALLVGLFTWYGFRKIFLVFCGIVFTLWIGYTYDILLASRHFYFPCIPLMFTIVVIFQYMFVRLNGGIKANYGKHNNKKEDNDEPHTINT